MKTRKLEFFATSLGGWVLIWLILLGLMSLSAQNASAMDLRGLAGLWLFEEVAIFSRALSEEEVLEAMNKGIGRPVEPGGKLATTWSNIKSR